MKKILTFFAACAGISFFCPAVSAQSDTLRVTTLDEVVVTGTRAEVSRANIPMTVSVVSRAEIEAGGESALLPVLSAHVPGMFVTERGVTGFGVAAGASGGITMRGIGGSPTTGMLVLIDGHPQYMGIMGHHLADAYVTANVEKVEVIRGPASILYGSNAMGGVINIISRQEKRDGWNAGGRVEYGSYNTLKYMGSAGMKRGRYDGFVSVGHDRTDGHRANSAFDLTSVYARSGYAFNDHIRLWGDVNIASYRSQNPGAVDLLVLDNIADIVRGVASATIENNFDRVEGALKLFYNFGDHRINNGHAPVAPPLPFRFRSRDQNLGVNLYQIFRPFKGNTITAGVDHKRYGGHAWNKFNNGTNTDLVDTTLHETAGYVVVQQAVTSRLSLTAGLRLERNNYFGTEWVPQGGVAWRPLASTVLKASVSKGFRNPTLREMFMGPEHNAALRPERVLNYEVSAGQGFLRGTLWAEVTGFIADGSNIIQQETPGVSGKYVNTGALLNKGIEASLRWNAARGLTVRGNYSYLHMRRPVAYAPGRQLHLSLAWTVGRWSIDPAIQHIHGLYTSPAPGAARESYTLLGARVSLRANDHITVFANGENLTDRRYEIMRGYPMPGLTVMCGVSVSFARHSMPALR